MQTSVVLVLFCCSELLLVLIFAVKELTIFRGSAKSRYFAGINFRGL